MIGGVPTRLSILDALRLLLREVESLLLHSCSPCFRQSGPGLHGDCHNPILRGCTLRFPSNFILSNGQLQSGKSHVSLPGFNVVA
jgi:hypothetical protein